MALLDIANIYNASDSDPIFLRFMAGCLVAARDVKAEDPGTERHAERLDWANALFTGDLGAVRQRTRAILRYAIATNSTFQSMGTDVDDNAIAFMIAGSINVNL